MKTQRDFARSILHEAPHDRAALRLIVWLAALLVLLTGALPVEAQSPSEGGDDFYGINFVAPYDPWLSLARESGARIVRWQFNWRDHEPSPGVWDWTKADEPIRAWRQAGLRVHAILHNPPDFALVHPGSGLMPRNIDLPWDHPDNGWGRYCYEFANRYRGQIASYEIWNEPDLDIYWEGTAQEYFYLLRSCYQAIKAADPTVPVAMAGMVLLADRGFFPEVVRLAAEDPDGPRNNYYFDAAAVHMYGDPDLVYSLTNQARGVLNSYGMGYKPIWITETNVALRGYATVPDTPRWGRATEDEAAWYILQAVSNAYAAGAERFMIFRLADDGMEEAYGLLRSDASPRPGYYAYQLAATLLRDIVQAEREVRNDVIITRMRRADGARIITLYQVSGTPLTVEVEAEREIAVLINSAGGYSTITPENNVYTVSLPPARDRDVSNLGNYSVGGPVLVIVEFDNQPPSASIESIPVPGDRTAVALRWAGDDGEFGTGVMHYDVEVSRDGGPWEPWLTATTERQAVFELSGGGEFAFRVRATDQAGNVGDYSEPLIISARQTGLLIARIVDLRGQGVPFARVELEDGSLHDADGSGVARIEVEPGTVRIERVDGSAHGQLTPPPVEVGEEQETRVIWMLQPTPNLISDGTFDRAARGWEISSPLDVQIRAGGGNRVLRFTGARRPWGPPSASVSLTIPPAMTEGVLSFRYRLSGDSDQVFRVRIVGGSEQAILWQSTAATAEMTRVWVDLGAYAGQSVTLHFELWGTKGASGTLAELDDVIVGNVPVLASDGR
ncbi:MAG TPA: hypothetical protein ENI95_05610 [Chloroflexi bacterium]|nr:hypothetical protein [Chloroflexota bacterium]